MNAIQLLTIGQTSTQRDSTGSARQGGESGEVDGFAALLTRVLGVDRTGAKTIPLDQPAAEAADEAGPDGTSRLALTVGGSDEASTFSLDDAATSTEGQDATEGMAAPAPTIANQQPRPSGSARTGQTAAAQTGSPLATPAAPGGQATAAGQTVDGATTENPGLLDPAADNAEGEPAKPTPEPARKSAFEDFEAAWRRLASGRQLDVDTTTLKVKPTGGEDGQALRAQPVTAQIDAGASLLGAKGEAGDVPNPQGQFGLDGGKATERAGAADALARSSTGSQAASPGDQIAMQIRRAAAGGADRITLQLHPRDLGTVEVRLEFGDGASVRAAILVERPETLELLQRDARLLQRALNEAGLEADGGSLSFDLRGEGNQGGYAEGDGSGGAEGEETLMGQDDGAGAAEDDEPAIVDTYAMAVSDGRLDIRI